MSSDNKNLRAALILPIMALLAVATIASAFQDDSDLEATIKVLPAAAVDCKPDLLSIKSNGEYVTCFIELSGAEVDEIDVPTVKLSVLGKGGSVDAELSPTFIGDYDFDGLDDLMVVFSRPHVIALIGDLDAPTDFVFVVSGYLGVFPFSGNDTVKVVEPQQITLVRYLQSGAKELEKGTVYRLDDLDLDGSSTTLTHFSGHFFTASDERLHGFSAFHLQGKFNVTKNINFFGMKFKYKKEVQVKALAQLDEMEDCYAFEDMVHCEGSGFLLLSPGGKTRMERFTFDIDDGKAEINGGQQYSDIFSVTVPVNYLKIK
ncbi:hypothetical protein A3K63_03485 [Candidatus Micrarchaeota archaeon RBG_16_49_10]|nr:MAG: hypothetical protein A3K63_03485 [Candidatus Micrarchaeota archaeon RBG_16_49_10]